VTPEYAELRRQLWERARGKCECGGEFFDGCELAGAEVDHFFGRAKAEESAENCWLLSPECHRQKTDNKPEAGYWLRRFMAHCNRQIEQLVDHEAPPREGVRPWLDAYRLAANRYGIVSARAAFARKA
jgi:hypothetical protein